MTVFLIPDFTVRRNEGKYFHIRDLEKAVLATKGAAKEVAYSHLAKLFSKGWDKAAVWKLFNYRSWAVHIVVSVIETGAHGCWPHTLPTAAKGKGATQPVNTDIATNYVAFGDTGRVRAALRCVQEHKENRPNSSVMMTGSLVFANHLWL